MSRELNRTYQCAKHKKLTFRRHRNENIPKCPTCGEYCDRVFLPQKNVKRVPKYMQNALTGMNGKYTIRLGKGALTTKENPYYK